MIVGKGSFIHDNALYVLGACYNNNLATLGSDEWRNKLSCFWTYISLQRDFRPGTHPPTRSKLPIVPNSELEPEPKPNFELEPKPNSELSVRNICQVNFNVIIICDQFLL